MKIMPKVIFIPMNIDANMEDLYWYANPKNSEESNTLNYYSLLLDKFPNFKGIINERTNENEIYCAVNTYLKPELLKIQKDITKNVKVFQLEWNKVNNFIMSTLSTRLNIEWPDDSITIIAKVGLLPVCPRWITKREFVCNYNSSIDDMIATTIHEICHFLYFEKWKELYPNYEVEEFDSPHIAWYLSEAIIDPIINIPEFQEILIKNGGNGYGLGSYDCFYNTKISGISIVEELKSIWNNNNTENAIKKAYEYFLKNEKIIKEDM